MNVIRSSLIYSLFTSISRVFGFLRDIFIANFLGTGVIADIFFVAFRLPKACAVFHFLCEDGSQSEGQCNRTCGRPPQRDERDPAEGAAGG